MSRSHNALAAIEAFKQNNQPPMPSLPDEPLAKEKCLRILLEYVSAAQSCDQDAVAELLQDIRDHIEDEV